MSFRSKHSTMPVRFFVLVMLAHFVSQFQATLTYQGGSKCPCSNPDWCKPVQVQYKKEIFIFSVTDDHWPLYDWDKLTTVVLFGANRDPQLTCHAHSKGVRVIMAGNFPTDNLTIPSARSQWVSTMVKSVSQHFLDGVNVDYEDAIPQYKPQTRQGLTDLMAELKTGLRNNNPHAQVTFDVAWSADCIDQRCYDYHAISDIVDFVFVMSYDERSQIYGPCIAWANSAFNNTKTGLNTFLKLGISPSKLVLGVPWYGYDYPCIKYNKSDGTCSIKEVPFRGVNCSDASGRQRSIADIVKSFPSTEVLWDNKALSPYFTYVSKPTGQIHQIWFDNVKSLKIKYEMALELDLRGVGMWNADTVDYSNTSEGEKQRKEMWGALPDYKKEQNKDRLRSNCPCQNPEWCKQVPKVKRKEVFVFSLRDANWRMYDWDKITTVALFGANRDPQLMCHAHSLGIPVVLASSPQTEKLADGAYRSEWVEGTIQSILDQHLDGVNIDFEGVIWADRSNDSLRRGLTAAVQELNLKLRQKLPTAQISFDVVDHPGVSPVCTNQRCYEYGILKDLVDFFFVMSYDERSQLYYKPCVAWANSALNNTLAGILSYMRQFDVPVDKMILGIPWYGYNYPCLNYDQEWGVCYIEEVVGQPWVCTSGVGKQNDYKDIIENLAPSAIGGVKWHKEAASPYFTYLNSTSGKYHQVWFDNVESLKIKYNFARIMDLRGVGMWAADSIDYTNTTRGREQRRDMWGALPQYQPKYTQQNKTHKDDKVQKFKAFKELLGQL